MKRNRRSLHAPGPVWLMLVVLLAFCGTSLAEDVTFRVDMSTQVGHGLFDAASDAAVVRGTFNGWSGVVDVLSDPDADQVYEIVLDLTAGYYEYKVRDRSLGRSGPLGVFHRQSRRHRYW